MLSSISDNAAESGRIILLPKTFPLGAGKGSALDVFRSHIGAGDTEPVYGHLETDGRPSSERLLQRLTLMVSKLVAEETGLIYVHRGYHTNYRTPLLQTLLNGLPRFGGITTIRARCLATPPEVQRLLEAQLRRFKHILVVDDRHERITLGAEPAGCMTVEFALVSARMAEHQGLIPQTFSTGALANAAQLQPDFEGAL